MIYIIVIPQWHVTEELWFSWVRPVFQSWKIKIRSVCFMYSVFWVLNVDFDLCKCEAMMTRKFKENALSILGQRWLKSESLTGRYLVLASGFFQIGQKFSKMITSWGLNWSWSIMAEIAQREIGVWSAKQGRANELDNPPSSSWTLKLISNFSAATALPSSNDCKKNQDVIVIALTKEIPNLFDILNCSCIFFCWQISFFAITWLPFKTFTNCCQAHEKLSFSFLQRSIGCHQRHQEFPPDYVIKKPNQIPQLLNYIFLLMSKKYVSVANGKYVLGQWVACSHGCMVAISLHFLLQSSKFY